MKNNRTFTIAFFGILAVILLAFFYFNFKDKRYSWYENYKAESDQPYGTEFIMKMLKGYGSGKFTYNTKKRLSVLLDSAKENQSYVFIGEAMYLDSLSNLALARFIANGNDAFIAVTNPPKIISTVWFSECADEMSYPFTEAITVDANFYHPQFAAEKSYPFSYRMRDRDVNYQWKYLGSIALCDSVRSIVPLGYIDPTLVNFFKIPYGEGNLYLHTNPIVFTNYFMTQERNTAYASGVFSHLKHENVIWDEFSKVPSFNYGNSLDRSPLYFIMQQQSLRYAWWILLITTILYIFFAAKRKQKIIPVIEPKANTSLQFVKMIASLHFLNQNHKDMALKKMKHFLYQVRTKYNLSTNKIDDAFIKKLSLKSQVSEEEINSIFKHYKVVEEFKNITDSRLVDLYIHIDKFYKQRK